MWFEKKKTLMGRVQGLNVYRCLKKKLVFTSQLHEQRIYIYSEFPVQTSVLLLQGCLSSFQVGFYGRVANN